MKLGLAIHEMHRSETSLAAELVKVAQRHKVEHGIYHVARDLARWSQAHARDLIAVGRRYELHLTDKTEDGKVCWPVSGKKPANCWCITPTPAAAARRPAPAAPHRGRGIPGLGAARSRWPGSQRHRTAVSYQALPPRDPSPDAVGQRDAERNLPASVGELIAGRQQLQEP